MSTNNLYYAGDTVYDVLTVLNSAGVGIWADATPTLEVLRNNVADASVTYTVSQDTTTGDYLASILIPSGYSPGDQVAWRYKYSLSSQPYSHPGSVIKLANPSPSTLSVGTLTANQLEITA